jgi:hypothetical protein
MHPKLQQIFDRLAAIHHQVQRIADEEAKAALVGGVAAQGVLDPQRQRLLDESEKLLDAAEKLLSGKAGSDDRPTKAP